MRIDLVKYFTGTAPTQICLDKRSSEAVLYLLSRREFHALQIARLTRHFLNVNLEKDELKNPLGLVREVNAIPFQKKIREIWKWA